MAKAKKPARPAEPVWLKHSWWLIPLVAIFIYVPAIQADFTLDDVLIVEENTYLTSLNKIPEIWRSHYWAGKIDATDTGLYRPLTLTTYNLQHVLHGPSPMFFHLVNILLHALVCFVLMKAIQLLTSDTMAAVVTGFLFAIHPIHTEAVAGIVGRAEILAALFILTSMITYHRWRFGGGLKWLALLVVSGVAAMTSKEHGFMVPVLLVLQEFFYAARDQKYKRNFRLTGIAVGATTCAAVLLWMVRSAVTGPTVAHELWTGVEAAERMATSLRIVAEYMGMHILPLHLSADYWSPEVPIVGFGHMQVLLSILLIAGLGAAVILWRKKWPVPAWGLAFFFLTLLPVSNFLFAAGFLKAERILYIPSIGFITALAALGIRAYRLKQGKWPAIVLMLAVSLFFMWKTWTRSGDWKNNYTLALATLETSPESPRFNNMMGLELRALKKNAEALTYFEKAVRSNTRHVPALVNLGTEYRNMGRHQEAAATLERALELDPNTMATYVNLMSVYRSMEAYDKNVAVADKAIQRFPRSAAVIWNAANAYQLKGDMTRANELRAIAREIDPGIGGGK